MFSQPRSSASISGFKKKSSDFAIKCTEKLNAGRFERIQMISIPIMGSLLMQFAPFHLSIRYYCRMLAIYVFYAHIYYAI